MTIVLLSLWLRQRLIQAQLRYKSKKANAANGFSKKIKI